MIKICLNQNQCGVIAHNCPKEITACHNCGTRLLKINTETYLKKYAIDFWQYDYSIPDYEFGPEVTAKEMGFDLLSGGKIKSDYSLKTCKKLTMKEKVKTAKPTTPVATGSTNAMQLDLALTSSKKLAMQYDMLVQKINEDAEKLKVIRDQLNSELDDALRLQTTEIMHISEILEMIFEDCPTPINPQKHRYNNGTLGMNSQIRIAEEYGTNVKCIVVCIPADGSTFDGRELI